MSKKICFKCHRVMPIEEFYRHPLMADGHLNKCKSCAKRDVRENRAARREQYSAYERLRFNRPERKKAIIESQRRRRKLHPEKRLAWQAVAAALRKGMLVRRPCELCGKHAQAHHEDYSRPLAVRWLCFRHHREIGHGQHVVQKRFRIRGRKVSRTPGHEQRKTARDIQDLARVLNRVETDQARGPSEREAIAKHLRMAIGLLTSANGNGGKK